MEKVIEMIKQTQFDTDVGMNFDIREVLGQLDEINQYKIKCIDNMYILEIELKEFSFQNAKECFDEFFNFIKYGDANIYRVEKVNDLYHVSFWTITAERYGAHFEIDFY